MKSDVRCMFVTISFVLLLMTMPSMAEETIVLVSTVLPDSEYTRMQDKILGEAFVKPCYNYKSEYYPSKRCTYYSTKGIKDGKAARIYEFNEKYPTLIRVEEPYSNVQWVAYAANPDIKHVSSWSELRDRAYTVGYKRGIKMCEDKLIGLIDDGKLKPVDKDIQGFMKLAANRNDVYVGVPKLDMDKIVESEEFKDAGIRDVGILASKELYMFLHEKHKTLAPKLAEAIRTVK